MTLLSTSSHLIKVGQDYSAGQGISINDHVISVTGEFGKTYSAGDNISIYEQDEQLYISSKDWTNDIANASSNAYNAATAQIPEPQDLSYISSKVDDKLDSTAFTNWQTGQYTTDLQTIEGQITNKLDISSFSSVSASFLTDINIPESATWNEVSTTVQSNSAQWAEGGTGDEEVNSFVYNNSATINEVNTTYQQNSASYLTEHQDISNKLDTTAFSTVSGEFLTAAPADMATTGDVAELAQTISETYQVKGDYLVRSDSANFYPANNPSGFITGVDLSPYYTTADANTLSSMLSGAIDYVSANSSGTLTGDAQGAVDTVYNISGSIISGTKSNKNFTATNVDNIKINNTTIGKNNTITTDHAGLPWNNWSIGKDFVHLGPEFMPDYWQQYQRVYLDKNGLSSMSGTILDKKLIWKAILNTDIEGNNNTITAINGSAIPVGDSEVNAYVTNNSASINESKSLVQSNSSTWNDITAYQSNSATLNDVSTTVQTNSAQWAEGDEFPVSADEAIQYVQTNSGTIDDTVTAYQNNSATYLTAHQAISAEEWNNCYNNVNTNSGAWGGSALPISAGKGVGIGVVNNTLVVSSTITGYVWASASLFTTATPTKNTSYTLSDSCSNYDKLEVDFYDINNWRTQMDCPIPPNIASSGTRGGYFNVVPQDTTTGSNVWFKCFNWSAIGNKWYCYCSELTGKGGSTAQAVNANQPDNPPKVIQIIGWKRVEV